MSLPENNGKRDPRADSASESGLPAVPKLSRLDAPLEGKETIPGYEASSDDPRESEDEHWQEMDKSANSGTLFWLLASVGAPFVPLLALHADILNIFTFLFSLPVIFILILIASTFMAKQVAGESSEKIIGLTLMLTFTGVILAAMVTLAGCKTVVHGRF